jgi:hypothetical protein
LAWKIVQRLLFVWNQSDCEYQQIPVEEQGESKKDFVYKKSLAKVFHRFPLWNKHHTLILDDSPNKFDVDCSANALHPPAINGLERTDPSVPSDDELNQQKQIQFFELLAKQCRVPEENVLSRELSATPFELRTFLATHATEHMGWTDEKKDNKKASS